jgi:GrpB-like predicted nucleotidyltransferase (UPF0157 family)
MLALCRQEIGSMQGEKNQVLGLEPKKVRLLAYTPLWAQLFEQEAERIRQAIGHLILGLEHIGSTAIPELKAKPILDMMAGVESLERAQQCIEPLEAIGYEYARWAGVPDAYVFGKERWRTHLLHVVEYDGENWWNNLRFRDRLRGDPALVEEYAKLKEELSHRYRNDRAAYTDAKAEFIRRIMAA